MQEGLKQEPCFEQGMSTPLEFARDVATHCDLRINVSWLFPLVPRGLDSPLCPCLAHQKERIRALEPLKAKLVTVNDDCNKRILAMRAEEKTEISMLKKEKMNLLKLIDKKNEEKISLQSEVYGSNTVTNSLNPCHPTTGVT